MQLTVKSSLVIGGVSLIGLIGTARAESSWAEAVPRSPPPLVPPSTPPGAGAPEPPPPATHVFPLNVRVGTDFAGYADSDHVFVVTPSLAGHVENPTAGWSVDGSYRVDVVSAASVDIVSTASRNYTEVRQAGTLAADYRPNTWGGAVNGSVSSEPDYLSWSAGRKRDEGRARKERDAPFGLQSHLRHRRPYGDPLLGLSRRLDVEALKGGLTLVLERDTIGSFVVDGVFEDGDPSKPAGMFRCSRRGPRSRTLPRSRS